MAEAVAHERAAPRQRAAFATRAFVPVVAGCTAAVGLFLALRLTAWPPHEDETLALFVGRKSFDDVLGTVLNQRGGAPLHFVFAWAVAHLGGGLAGLRVVSAVFAVASVPLIALLATRLAGRQVALVTTVLASASWMLLFHGVYGRMYSIFLATSLLSFLALLHAVERGGRWAWVAWATATLLCVSAHPYGAIVLVAQGAYVLALRTRLREAAIAFAAVLLLGIPFWRTDLVLAGRFEVGVGGGGERLGNPLDVLRYLRSTLEDFTAGYRLVVAAVLALGIVGAVSLWRTRPRSAMLVGAVVLVPTAFLLLARFGSSAAPEPRHLIFAFPFVLTVVAAGLIRATAPLGRHAAVATVVALVALVVLEGAWGWKRTPELYRGEPSARVAARDDASAWLAETSRSDDVLFGYDPLFLQAWRRGGALSQRVVPRADPRLALRTLEHAPKPLGRGVWVFDTSDTGNALRRLHAPLRNPQPREAFETRAFGPFLVIRTVEPTRQRPGVSLARAARAARRQGDLGRRRRHEPPHRSRRERPPRRSGATRRAFAVELLAVARRVLERGQPGGDRPLFRLSPAHRREGREGADGATDEEVAQPAAPGTVVHDTIVRVLVCTLGDLTLDVVVRLGARFVPGDDTPATSHLGAGGQAANVAAWAVACGAEARLIAKRGADAAGELAAREIERRGVELCGATGPRGGIIVSVSAESDERSMLTDRGSAPELRPEEIDVKWLRGCDRFHLSGYALLGGPIAEAGARAAGAARAQGAAISVDLASAAGIEAFGAERVVATASPARAGRPVRDRQRARCAGKRALGDDDGREARPRRRHRRPRG